MMETYDSSGHTLNEAPLDWTHQRIRVLLLRIAPDEPLLLYDCAFENLKFQYSVSTSPNF
jgi:hypothetical protein